MDTYYLYRAYQAIQLANPVPVTARLVYLRLQQKGFEDRLKDILNRPEDPSDSQWNEVKKSSGVLMWQLLILQTLSKALSLEEIEQSREPTELDEAVVNGLWAVQEAVQDLKEEVQEGGYLQTNMGWDILGEMEAELHALAPLLLQINMCSENGRDEHDSQEGSGEIRRTVSGSADLTVRLGAPGVATWSSNVDLGKLRNADPLDHMGSESTHRLAFVASILTKTSTSPGEAKYFKQQLHEISRLYADPDPKEEEDPCRRAKHDAVSTLAELVTVSTSGNSRGG